MYCCVAVMFFGLGSAFGATQPGSSRDRATPSHTVTVTASPAPAPSASASASARKAASQDSPEQRSRTAGAGVGAGSTIPGDGTYLVGEDIQPGTYQAGGADGRICSWQRTGVSVTSLGEARGPARVSVQAGETFTSDGCQEWTLSR